MGCDSGATIAQLLAASPITAGLFDQVVVAVGINSKMKYLFPLDQRIAWLRTVFADQPKVKVESFEGLTAHYCQQIGARYLLRGLRNASDNDYEKTISQLNEIVGSGLETFFLISRPAYSHISSTIVREIIKGGGDAGPFIPEKLAAAIGKWEIQ